jgi:hypothetical protein
MSNRKHLSKWDLRIGVISQSRKGPNMPSRKTIPVDTLKEWVNRLMETPDSMLYMDAPGKLREMTAQEAFRMGAISLLERVLMATDNYKGFSYQPEQMIKRAEKPGERSIIKDETRRIYY